MLDGHAGRQLKLAHQAPGRVGVGVVVEAHGLAGQHPGVEHRAGLALEGVQRRFLVGVLPVAQLHRQALEAQKLGLGELLKSQKVGDGRVVGRGVGKGFIRQPAAKLAANAGAQGLQHLGVVGRVTHRQHRLVVLGRGPQHGRPPDVDVLEALLKRSPSSQGLPERIQVDTQQVNPANALGLQLGLVLGALGRQQPGMNAGVKGLDPPVQNLGKACHLGDIRHLQPRRL